MILWFLVGLSHIIYDICDAILCFEVVSGLKVNLAKSVLVPVGDVVDVDWLAGVVDVDWLAGIMGCGVSLLPLKYLGFPLGASYNTKSIWNNVIEKIERHLASWKMMYGLRVVGLPL